MNRINYRVFQYLFLRRVWCCFSLQSFPALSSAPSVKDWSETSVPTDMCVGMIRRSVSKLEPMLNEMIEKLSESGKTSSTSLEPRVLCCEEAEQ